MDIPNVGFVAGAFIIVVLAHTIIYVVALCKADPRDIPTIVKDAGRSLASIAMNAPHHGRRKWHDPAVTDDRNSRPQHVDESEAQT